MELKAKKIHVPGPLVWVVEAAIAQYRKEVRQAQNEVAIAQGEIIQDRIKELAS